MNKEPHHDTETEITIYDIDSVRRPGRRPELESDVHPQRRPEDGPLPDESDNIPGDENDPNLVQSSRTQHK